MAPQAQTTPPAATRSIAEAKRHAAQADERLENELRRVAWHLFPDGVDCWDGASGVPSIANAAFLELLESCAADAVPELGDLTVRSAGTLWHDTALRAYEKAKRSEFETVTLISSRLVPGSGYLKAVSPPRSEP